MWTKPACSTSMIIELLEMQIRFTCGSCEHAQGIVGNHCFASRQRPFGSLQAFCVFSLYSVFSLWAQRSWDLSSLSIFALVSFIHSFIFIRFSQCWCHIKGFYNFLFLFSWDTLILKYQFWCYVFMLWPISLKVIVHPKMMISFLCWTQKKIFWRMLLIKQLMVPIDFHRISFPIIEVNGDQQLLVLQKIFFCEERNVYRFGIT